MNEEHGPHDYTIRFLNWEERDAVLKLLASRRQARVNDLKRAIASNMRLVREQEQRFEALRTELRVLQSSRCDFEAELAALEALIEGK